MRHKISHAKLIKKCNFRILQNMVVGGVYQVERYDVEEAYPDGTKKEEYDRIVHANGLFERFTYKEFYTYFKPYDYEVDSILNVKNLSPTEKLVYLSSLPSVVSNDSTFLSTIKQLLTNGADASVCNNLPVRLLAKNQCLSMEVLCTLLAYGADPLDSTYTTASQIAHTCLNCTLLRSDGCTQPNMKTFESMEVKQSALTYSITTDTHNADEVLFTILMTIPKENISQDYYYAIALRGLQHGPAIKFRLLHRAISKMDDTMVEMFVANLFSVGGIKYLYSIGYKQCKFLLEKYESIIGIDKLHDLVIYILQKKDKLPIKTEDTEDAIRYIIAVYMANNADNLLDHYEDIAMHNWQDFMKFIRNNYRCSFMEYVESITKEEKVEE